MWKWVIRSFIFLIIGLSLMIPAFAKEKQIWYRDQVAVLMYHHIHDKDKSTATITTALFQSQLEYLLNHGYHFINLDQFKSFLSGAPIPDNAVLVTFDDGYESFHQNAFPILQKLKIPAVNFVITGTLAHPDANYLHNLSRAEIEDISSKTNEIQFQCHTDNLHGKSPQGGALLTTQIIINGQKESLTQYKQRILQDTQTCIQSLNGLQNHTVEFLAYPYGIYSPLAENLLQQAGIHYAFTVIPEITTRQVNLMQIPRINAGSPWITPQSLHHTIIRRVVSISHPYDQVNVKQIIDQIGGAWAVSTEGIHITFRDRDAVLTIRSQQAAVNSETIQLHQPPAMQNGSYMMRLDDVEKLLGVTLFYNPDLHKYMVQQSNP